MANYFFNHFNETVRRNIQEFPEDVRAEYSKILKLLDKYGPVIIPGKTKVWEGSICEITANGNAGWWRVFYIFVKGSFILLHTCRKQGNKTPNDVAKEVRKRARKAKQSIKEKAVLASGKDKAVNALSSRKKIKRE